MRRLVVIVATTSLVPFVAWGAVSADHEPPLDCSESTLAAPIDGCAASAPPAPVEPAAPPADDQPPPESTDPAVPTTTLDPNSTVTTLDPNAVTTTSTTVPTTPTTAVVDPAATTTTVVADPTATTTTTIVDPAGTTTTVVDPNATTTTVPAPPEDIESEPVLPPVEAPGGRVILPAGAIDSGQVRAITFPVAGPISYVNDWGACRDGCNRAHKGNDLIGDRLQPLLAMHEGVIDRVLDHPTAGYGLVIRDGEGWEYHIYHVNNDTPGTDDGADDGTWRYAAGIEPGARVTAGQLIGWMGDSGNSEGSVPHAHVELRRPDGVAINPYWSLRQAQRDANCAVATVDAPLEAEPATLDVDPAALAAAPLGPLAAASAEWLAAGWAAAALPEGWQPLTLTGGQPGSGAMAARMWISTTGFTPIDGAALRVGDARFDVNVDCTAPLEPQLMAPIPTELGAILATIRSMESGGDYTVAITTSTASGAYGFLDSSWGGFGGYARARDAPPAVQDAKAAELAAYILGRNGGDVSTIPVSWYIGHVPIGAEWDTVPPYPGNRLTPREYQDRWMRRYAQFLGTPDAWAGAAPSSWVPVDTSMTCRTVVVDLGDADDPQYVLTQAHSFASETSGRAIPLAVDPCDPARLPPQPVPAAILPEAVAIKPSGQH